MRKEFWNSECGRLPMDFAEICCAGERKMNQPNHIFWFFFFFRLKRSLLCLFSKGQPKCLLETELLYEAYSLELQQFDFVIVSTSE